MSTISVIIPTLNPGSNLVTTLACLFEANANGHIREVIISDGGSSDQTLDIANDAGARIVEGPKGRGQQLRAAGDVARGDWLLFLHADTVLEAGWMDPVQEFISTAYDRKAAVFKLAFNANGVAPALVAWGANLRTRFFQLPYGDQGLLISKPHYDRVGGYLPMPLFEDVDLVRRIRKQGGREALTMLTAKAITSADRYSQDGYIRRVWRNWRCLRLYDAGVPPQQILEFYHGKQLFPATDHHGKAPARGDGENQA